MTEFAWFISQWILFVVIWLASGWQLLRERERSAALRRDIASRDRWLWECCLFLRAARRKGQVLDPFVDGLVDRTLAKCPSSASGTHVPNATRPTCRDCGLGLG